MIKRLRIPPRRWIFLLLLWSVLQQAQSNQQSTPAPIFTYTPERQANEAAGAPTIDFEIREMRVTGLGVSKNMMAELIAPVGEGTFPAVVVLHTSGNVGAPDIDYARALARKGYVSLVPYYFDAYGITYERRQDATTIYAEQLYADFVSLLQYLKDNFRTGKSGAVGFSMGGYWALVLAATKQVSAGISYYGALSGGGSGLNLRYRFDEVFAADSSPVLILHGSNDSTVPVRLANDLAKILSDKRSPYELAIYQGVEHSFDRGTNLNTAARDDAWSRTQALLGRHVSLSFPSFEITMSKSAYAGGEIVTATEFRPRNPSSSPVAVVLKIWISVPGTGPVTLIEVGSDGSFMLPSNLDVNAGPISLFQVTATFPPKGNWEFNARVTNPSTQALYSEDINPFVIQ